MILICFGTRPEYLKIKPVLSQLDKLKVPYQILFTGQHTTLIKDIKVNYKIEMVPTENRLDQIISDCLTQFPETACSGVLVQGDTASAFACALAAFHRQKKIYYLEAGLRTSNLNHPFPEEGYRQMIARLSNINFCPTEVSAANLLKENLTHSIVTGNTVLDNILDWRAKCHYGGQSFSNATP